MNNIHRGFAATLAVLTVVACSSNDKSSSTMTQPGADKVAAESAAPGYVDSAAATATTAPTVEPPTKLVDPSPRKLVIRMTVGVEVPDVSRAIDDVIALAERHGGQLYNSSIDLTDPHVAGGDLVFKVPPGEADAFIEDLGRGIGRRVSMRGTTDDVTDQVTDLDARIETAAASVERVRLLLAGATALNEVVQLEGELTTRQTTLEQLTAQKANLDGQVAMATITVTLSTAPAAPTTDDATPKPPKDSAGDAFRKGWDTFTTAIGAVVLFLGYTAPFLVLALAGLLVLRRVTRRRAVTTTRSRAAAPPPPPVPVEDPRTCEPDSVGAARTS